MSEALRASAGEVPEAEAGNKGSLWRSIGVGVAFTVLMSAYEPVSSYFVHSSAFTRSHMPFALLFLVMVLSLVVNPLLRRLWPKRVFTSSEIAVILSVGFLGLSIPTMVGRFVATVSAPEYFASAENEWPTYVIPNLTSWLYPSNESGSVGLFYQGLPPGETAVWMPWLVPLFWWFLLITAILFGCFCLSVILRQQWSERERLSFPLVTVPLMIASGADEGGRFPSFARDKLYWIGFGIPLTLILWNVTGLFVERLPIFAFLNANNLVDIGRGFPLVFFRFDFYVLSFAYFTNLEILFSVWLFCVLGILQEGMNNRIGIPVGVGWQSQFALAFFVVWGVWTSRSHLKDVWRKAVTGDPEIDDSGEMLSYRTAVLGAGVSVVVILFWMNRAGMEFPLALVYLFSNLVLYLGMAKIVAMTGLVSLRGSVDANGLVKSLMNLRNISDTGLAANNMFYALYSWNKGFCMPGAANSAKASEQVGGGGKRALGGAVMTAAVLAIIACTVVTLYLGYYGNGAQNFGSYDFTDGNRHPYNYTVSNIKDRADAEIPWWGMGFGSAGVVIMAALTALNYRVPWWPIHPVGFAVSYASPVRNTWFSVFIAWLIKLVTVRVGGMKAYHTSQRFFLGVLSGYSLGVFIAFVVDVVFFYGQGHPMHAPPL